MKPFAFLSSLILSLIFFSACSQTEKSNEEVSETDTQFIEITQQQFEANGMTIGSPMLVSFQEEVICNGYVNAPSTGMAKISSPLAGIIENIRFSPGEKVQKGSMVCQISSQELIILQQNYIQSIAEFKQAESAYNRSKALYKENIGSEKNLINQESEYQSMLAKTKSLSMQLKRLNLDLTKIKNGNFYQLLPVIAPISGYITNQDVVIGQFVEQKEPLIEIINTNQLQIELAVFEKDVAHLKPGQKVMYKTLGEESFIHEARLVSIGKSIQQDTKNIQCFAKIAETEKNRLVNFSFVNAKIIISEKQALGLPKEAVIKSGEEYYVFVIEKKAKGIYYLKKLEVSIGKINNHFIEILSPKTLTNVIVKGTYNL